MKQSKACTLCKQILLIAEFYKDRTTPDGYERRCKACKKQQRQEHRLDNHEAILAKEAAERKANPELHRERVRRSYALHAEARKQKARDNYDPIKQKIRYAKYCKAFPERVIASNAKWSAHNKTRKSELGKIWRAANKERTRQLSAKRRAQLRSNNIFSISDKEIIKLYQDPCFYCGSYENIQLDHVIAVTRGGNHGIGNLVSACKPCNQSKRDKTIMEWRVWKTATLKYLSERGK